MQIVELGASNFFGTLSFELLPQSLGNIETIDKGWLQQFTSIPEIYFHVILAV
jgi:hypothetical protein